MYRTPKFAGVIRYNVLKSCATRVCCACKDETAGVAVMYLTLRISRERHGRKNPLPFPPFRSGHMSAICARLTDKGKVGVQRGRETAGVPSFLPTAEGTASSPRRAPRRSRRSGGASPAEVQRKLSAPSGRTRLRSSSPPGFPVQEKAAARQGRTRLRQFACPGQSVQKKVPPRMGEPPARFVHPAKRAPCKSKFPKENPHAIG